MGNPICLNASYIAMSHLVVKATPNKSVVSRPEIFKK